MVSIQEILKLSINERILLAETIWDSIVLDERLKSEDLPISEAQKEELLSRLRDFESGKSKTYSWEEVKAFVKGE